MAKEYHCNPEVFLAQTYSRIARHLIWTDRLNAGDVDESAWQEKLGRTGNY